MPESAEGYAYRDDRIAGLVYRALPAVCAGADRDGALQGTRGGGAGGTGYRQDAVYLDEHDGEVRHSLRLHVGDSGDAAGPVAGILLDVARWPGSEDLFGDSSAIPYALALEHAVFSVC